MSCFRIGLVVEGPTDLVVIKKLLFSRFLKTHPDVQISFVDLQPSIDATSGSSEGGWQLVYAWCLKNNPEFRNTQYLSSGIFDDNTNPKQCDVLVVQMDSDICLELSNNKRFTSVIADNLATPIGRGEYIAAVLGDWLWPAPSVSNTNHVVVPTVESTETWLIAGLCDHSNPETINEPLKILAQIEYCRKGKPVPNNLKKIRKRYAAMNRWRKLPQKN